MSANLEPTSGNRPAPASMWMRHDVEDRDPVGECLAAKVRGDRQTLVRRSMEVRLERVLIAKLESPSW